MKLITINKAAEAMAKLASQEMPMALLYRVTKLFHRVDEEVAAFDKMRRAILEKYCDIEDGRYVPREECVPDLNREWAELEEIESELEIKEKIKLPLDSEIKLSYKDMCLLEEFFEIECPDEEKDSEK